jgi:hypothetical protein
VVFSPAPVFVRFGPASPEAGYEEKAARLGRAGMKRHVTRFSEAQKFVIARSSSDEAIHRTSTWIPPEAGKRHAPLRRARDDKAN